MIFNISGGTDIVALYSKWFIKHYKEDFVYVRNLYKAKMISRIYFKYVVAILFCNKNSIPILNHIKEIDMPILFHVTLITYKKYRI